MADTKFWLFDASHFLLAPNSGGDTYCKTRLN